MLAYITNIEFLEDAIACTHGIKTVKAVYARYGASSIENLTPSKISEVYADLYQLYAEN